MNTLYKIVDKAKAAEVIEKWQQLGLRVAFTNGCFDILHPGHVDYLEQSRNLADKLVLGLNTDASVKRLKGPERPIVSELDRARVMASLACIDLVILFNEDTPLDLITTIKPDILTKGGDYALDQIVGADFVINRGGMVIPVHFKQGYSTTSLISQVRNL